MMLFLSGRIIFYSGIPETVGFFSCEDGYFFSAEIFLLAFSGWETFFALLLTYFFTSGTGFGGWETSTTFFYAGLMAFWALLTYTFWLFCGCLFSLLAFIFSYSSLIFSSNLNSLMYCWTSSLIKEFTISLDQHTGSGSSFVISFQTHVNNVFQLFWVKLRNGAVSKLYHQLNYFPLMIFRIKLAWLAASKGCRKVHNSYSKHPNAQMSLF